MTKLVTYTSGDRPSLGAVQGDLIIDLARANSAFPQDVPSGDGWTADSVSFLSAGAPALQALKNVIENVSRLDAADARRDVLLVQSASVRLLPPIPAPPKIICVARNYGQACQGSWPAHFGDPDHVCPFRQHAGRCRRPVVVPHVSHQLDWEGELAVIIGKTWSLHQAAERARSRCGLLDLQRRDRPGLSVPHHAIHGGQELLPHRAVRSLPRRCATRSTDPHALEITTTVNGEVVQTATRGTCCSIFRRSSSTSRNSSTSNPATSSRWEHRPASASPASRRVSSRNGDHITVEIEGLGILSNPVIDEKGA